MTVHYSCTSVVRWAACNPAGRWAGADRKGEARRASALWRYDFSELDSGLPLGSVPVNGDRDEHSRETTDGPMYIIVRFHEREACCCGGE
jgi:hypothetical protein